VATNNAVSVQICLIDFAKATEEDFTRLQQIIDSINIGVLGEFNFDIDYTSVNARCSTPCTYPIVHVCEVNNVGRGHSVPNAFIETPWSEINDIITINVRGTLRITHLVVPTMIRSKQRSRYVLLSMTMGRVLVEKSV
jgi:NAD(P)-dependent dehydrogenase (short-subunit alcohol dehydrogenase family)